MGIAAAMVLALTTLAACGAAAEPTTAPGTPTAPAGQQTAAEETAPQAKLAPTFELPNAAGETVSLASYMGDKNVVLVFYRGFW